MSEPTKPDFLTAHRNSVAAVKEKNADLLANIAVKVLKEMGYTFNARQEDEVWCAIKETQL